MPVGTGAGDSVQTLFDPLRRLRASWPSRGWSWDSRLSCVSSSFSVEQEAKARACAAEALPIEWTRTTIGKASQDLRELAERCGGLRTGQLLLSGTAPARIAAFGLWWPWGDGMSISLRVGLTNLDWADEPYGQFRELFGVQL